jgi:hypothetical protein
MEGRNEKALAILNIELAERDLSLLRDWTNSTLSVIQQNAAGAVSRVDGHPDGSS